MLEAGRVALRGGACVGVVAAGAGYPEVSPTGLPIGGLDGLDPDVLCFHAGTARAADGSIRTAGGRVLTVVAHGADLDTARSRAYDNLDRIHFEGMRARRDIAMIGHIVEAAR
jgi:phosphoribosylamine-glycine ligase